MINLPDYSTGQPALTPVGTTGDVPGEQLRAFAAWESANAASMPEDDNGPVAAGGIPHFVRDGFRSFVLGMIAPMRAYAEHTALFDSFIGDAATIAALHAMLPVYANLIGLDQPGPN